MATKRRRKANTAMVFNPRGLSIGGRRTVRMTASARKNPVRKATVNPRRKRFVRRRKNPASVTGLLTTAIMAGIGVSFFDVIVKNVVPQSSSLVRIGTKFGGAYLFQMWGGKIPVLGKHKNDIALVLAVSGVVDLVKLYVLPAVAPTINSITGGAVNLLAAPAAAGDDLGKIWGSSQPQSNWNAYN